MRTPFKSSLLTPPQCLPLYSLPYPLILHTHTHSLSRLPPFTKPKSAIMFNLLVAIMAALHARLEKDAEAYSRLAWATNVLTIEHRLRFFSWFHRNFRYTHTYIYICVCVCVCKCMYVCIYVCIYICMYGCMYVRMYVCMYVCMSV